MRYRTKTTWEKIWGVIEGIWNFIIIISLLALAVYMFSKVKFTS
jgi:hypothetical protein